MPQYQVTVMTTVIEYKHTFVTANTEAEATAAVLSEDYSGGWIVTDTENLGPKSVIGCRMIEELNDRLVRLRGERV